MGITELIAAGKEFGIFEFYLPFILMFAILYGILQKIKIFGEKGNLNIIIALAASAFVMVYLPVGVTLSQFFANLFGQTLVVILSVLVLVVVLNMITSGVASATGQKTEALFDITKWAKWILLAVLLLAVGVFFSSGGAAFFPGLPELGISLPSFGISSQTLAIILVVAITGIIIWFMTREKAAAGKQG